jgi:hypothetical protein
VIAGRAQTFVAGIAVASNACMPAFAYADETIRVPKLYVEPTRSLPTQFAPAPRTRRWPYALLAVVVAVAAWTPVQLPHREDRAVQAEKLLELIR